jgi:hypothetical protein
MGCDDPRSSQVVLNLDGLGEGVDHIVAGTIAGVRRFSYVGKMSIFSMLLEGEASMVRWPLIGLDLTHFSDLVGSS